MNKDQILAALPQLNQADLIAIRAVTDALIAPGIGHAKAGTQSGPTQWLIEAMGAVLGHPIHLNGLTAKAFNKNAPIALAFINGQFKPAMGNKVAALALMRYLIKLLADDLNKMKVSVTRATLTQHLHRLGEVFNNAFPGYAEGQAASLIMLSILSQQK